MINEQMVVLVAAAASGRGRIGRAQTADQLGEYPAKFLLKTDETKVKDLIIVGAASRDGRRYWQQPKNNAITVFAPGTYVTVALPGGPGNYVQDSGSSIGTSPRIHPRSQI